MYLLNTSTRKLREFSGPGQVPYAILSHRWSEKEITFEDVKDFQSRSGTGVAKVTSFCEVAFQLGYEWCWVDTCCINKTSSAELSEAINSMFSWYQNAGTCIVYLRDVVSTEVDSKSFDSEFRASAWFLRSWTLQELLASAKNDIRYYSSNWTFLGSGKSLSKLVSVITTIDEAALTGQNVLNNYCIAERMSWASMRSATRVEDIAYSLLGIFDIQMPLVYGEGLKAFRRLQQAIMSSSDDETIFAWEPETSGDTSLLARSPSLFANSRYLRYSRSHRTRRTTYELMSRGVRFDSAEYVRVDGKVDILLLNAIRQMTDQRKEQIGIYLRGGQDHDNHHRVWVPLKQQLWRAAVDSNDKRREKGKSFYVPFDHNESVIHEFESMSTRASQIPVKASRGYDLSIVPPRMLQLANEKRRNGAEWLLNSETGGPICNIHFSPPFHGVSLIHLGIDGDLGRPVFGVLSDTPDISQANVSFPKLNLSIRDLSIDYTHIKSVERQLLPDRVNDSKDWYIKIWPDTPKEQDPWYQTKLWQHPKQQPDLNYFYPFPFDPKAVQGTSDRPVTSYTGWGIELISIDGGGWRLGFVKYTVRSNWASQLNKKLLSKILTSRPRSLMDSTYSIDLDTFKSVTQFPV